MRNQLKENRRYIEIKGVATFLFRIMESHRKYSESNSRRRSLLPLASEEKSYVPAFYRPRSAVEGRRRPTLERRSVSSLEDFNKEGDLDRILSPRLTPRGNVTPRRVREEDNAVVSNKEKSGSRSPRRAARGSEQLNMPLRPDTPFHGTRSSSRPAARTAKKETLDTPMRKASTRETNDVRKSIKEEDEIKERRNGNEDSGGDKEKGKVKSRACRPSTPLVTCGRQPLVRRTSKKRLDSTSEMSDKESVSSGIKPRNQRLRSAGGSEGSTCNSQASSRRSSIVSLSRSSSKVNLNDLPGSDPFSQTPNSTLPAPPGKRPNMATLLNVLQFKRTLRRKHNSRRPSVLAAASETIDEKEELELLEADPLAAPGQRFALGLSKEAQYAMLKVGTTRYLDISKRLTHIITLNHRLRNQFPKSRLKPNQTPNPTFQSLFPLKPIYSHHHNFLSIYFFNSSS